jgi:hypothetical protein|tara:strand:+ start:1464 stop:1661 length:198 start_codon:yes stop_codon:yes gene_type:complete
MKNGNAITRYKNAVTNPNDSIGSIKSVNNICPPGWYCLDESCERCIPNHVSTKQPNDNIIPGSDV